MITADHSLAAIQNMADTYTRLALAIPDSQPIEDSGFQGCIGCEPLPICNFAVQLRLDPWSAYRLRTLGEQREGFHVYVSPGDQPAYVEDLLRGADFHKVYELAAMIARPRSEPSEDLSKAEDYAKRCEVARFMTSQFFPKQNDNFCERVSFATAQACALDLHHLSHRGKIVAGIMLSRSEGMLGLYNLCVASTSRNRGLGSAVLGWCMDTASIEGRTVTLQCDPSLEGWYASKGFVSFGLAIEPTKSAPNMFAGAMHRRACTALRASLRVALGARSIAPVVPPVDAPSFSLFA